ncbi:MAG: Rrf2 family transcriptional regulator [Haliscomenobacteraceae bacterium CHB4]|nr:hypothetical protein [Saprospiraceae bacterium]MCE7923660.1 Rrf2 family transcriptional regulator [Haliscomenobacteraceae bacterium CHB4]
MFSKTFGYALRAITYVAIHGNDGKKVSLLDLSQYLDIPYYFLGKIMQEMVRHGILDSIKGPSGGFFTNGSTLDTSLIQILKITDGNLVFSQCALGIKRCNTEHPCPLHNDFAACRNGMLQALSSKKIRTLVDEIRAGEIYLAR